MEDAIFVMLDLIAIEASSFLALWIRYEFRVSNIEEAFMETICRYAPINMIITVGIFYLFRLYTRGG